MALPAWALALLVGVPLAQIPLVLYLSRWFELDGEAPLATPTRRHWSNGPVEDAGVDPWRSAPGRCPRCGSRNDPAYDFCGRCVAPL